MTIKCLLIRQQLKFRDHPKQLFKIVRRQVHEWINYKTNPDYHTTPSKLNKMKVESEIFENLFTSELKYVKDLFNANNYEIRIAGGAVRDILMNKVPADVDFATTATPQQMKDLFIKEGVRMLDTKGEVHGTIACRINDKENFEITTLRIDVVCDGRRAEVKFTDDWKEDAMRRDLTINAMFLALDGTVYDFYNGMDDLKHRRVLFVNNPVYRIQEDYLRIFRYFRFFGRIVADPQSHNAETLSAIRDNVGGLAGISGERIWAELRKIAVGNHAGPIVHTMINDCGMAEQTGLPQEPNMTEFDRVYKIANSGSNRSQWEPMTLLVALMRTEQDVLKFEKRVKFSKKDRLVSLLIINERSNEDRSMKRYQDLLLNGGGDKKDPLHRKRVVQLMLYQGVEPEKVEELRCWDAPSYPIQGQDLMRAGVRKGPDMSTANKHLFKLWKDGNYQSSQEQLLQCLPDVVSLNPNPPKISKSS